MLRRGKYRSEARYIWSNEADLTTGVGVVDSLALLVNFGKRLEHYEVLWIMPLRNSVSYFRTSLCQVVHQGFTRDVKSTNGAA